MVDYGHHAQNDRWAIEAVFPGLRGGFFVEAGACGGLQGSASYVLEREFGWKGICVEPLDKYYEILVQRRSCSTDPRCLAGVTGDVVEFLAFPDDLPRSGIRSLNKNTFRPAATVQSWAERSDATSETSRKETVTFSDLLEQHGAPAVVNYLCLDVEGAEMTILEPYDFESDRRILALSIEGSSCDAMLAGRGYVQVTNPYTPSPIDHYFVHPTLRAQVRDLVIR